jgi:ATP-dependent phosphoenolpyruvate carboxykinase
MTTKKTSQDMSPGTTVAYTGKFLRDSGQMTGSAGLDKFIVQECHCKHCFAKTRVAVNKPSVWTDPEEPGYDAQYARELKAEVGNTWMHIATSALYVVGQLDSRNST